MHQACGSGSERRQDSGDPDELPTYEETVMFRKHYQLRYPQLLSRTVHAVDSDQAHPAYIKRAHGLSTSRSTYYAVDAGGSERAVWRCRRERQGFELVFTRAGEQRREESVQREENVADVADLEEEAQEAEEEELMDAGAVDDIIGTTEALLDNKTGDHPPPLPPRQPPPPAYEESEQSPEHTPQTITLVSHSPTPFVYDFELLLHGRTVALRWQHSEVHEKGCAEFSCVERLSGRLLAEILAGDAALGMLVLHGRDLSLGVSEFLVVSAIAVCEEYPVRQVAMAN